MALLIIEGLAENGNTCEPFLALTLPPIEHHVGRREKLITRSREKYAAPRATVEEKIGRWIKERGSDPRRVSKGRIPFLPARLQLAALPFAASVAL